MIIKELKQDILLLLFHLKNPNGGDRYVLLSYITNPFRMSPNNSRFNHHSNKWECR